MQSKNVSEILQSDQKLNVGFNLQVTKFDREKNLLQKKV